VPEEHSGPDVHHTYYTIADFVTKMSALGLVAVGLFAKLNKAPNMAKGNQNGQVRDLLVSR
jgi:hypothetical protein